MTTLLHEAYLDISSRHAAVFPDEAHFMGYAARVMRGLIIDHARAQRACRRGGQFEISTLRTDIIEHLTDPRELTDISDALDELAAVDQPLAELVDLKFFCGFSFGPSFLAEPFDPPPWRVHELARKYLDGDRALEAGISRAVDFAHAPRTKGRQDLERAESGARSELHARAA